MISSRVGKLTYSEIEVNSGLRRALGLKPDQVIAEVTAAGMKGRGGAGFPTGMKWGLAAKAKGNEKFVVCNADEGEPGTFKDRVVLWDFAELVLEGMSIAAYAIGARTGIIYLRGEYTYIKPHLEAAIAKRRDKKLLGPAILGRAGFDFEIEVRMGSGAYVCGEETALVESLEGSRGEPRSRPPFPVDTGFLERPTVVNNVETLAWAACILSKGAGWFCGRGTEKSRGMKLFSVSGDCERPGVYEFPFGVTVADILKEAGGEGAKAVQVGGASGHCVPAAHFTRNLSYEDLSTGGSIIVFGQNRDMLLVAKNFLEFFVEESCGQCTPCREGTVKLLEGIEMLERGECSMQYLNELMALSETMQVASKCGLGQSAPNPFLSIVQHFKSELMGRTRHSIGGAEQGASL